MADQATAGLGVEGADGPERCAATAEAAFRILVVDDDEMNREVLSRMMKRGGHNVLVAEDGYAALDILRRQSVDLVLLDHMMPGLSGLDVLRRIREFAGPSELPVIMVTAKAQSRDTVEALENGANDFISKPVDLAVTQARVRAQLQRKAAEQALRTSAERLVLAVDGGDLAVWDWDLQTGRIYLSPRWGRLLGYPAGELTDAPEEWLDRIHPDDAQTFREQLRRHCEGEGESIEFEHRVLHRDGSYRWMRGRGRAVRERGGRAIRVTGSQRDNTEAKTTDSLTGLRNRLYVEDRLDRELSRPGGSSGFAVMLLDLDRYKTINDGLGSMAGDALLQETGRRIQRSEPAGADNVARFAADEFLVLLSGISSPEEAAAAGRSVLEAVTAPFHIGGQRVLPSARIGIALAGGPGATRKSLLSNAIAALHHARSNDNGRCAVFQPGMLDREMSRFELETDLRDALAEGQLTVFYQPKIALADGRISGFEALVRWRHPRRAMVTPSEFIPLAEETGMIVDIGRLVFRRACEDLARWRRDFSAALSLSVSVNVSVAQLSHPGLLQEIRRALEETGAPANRLRLEITESQLLANKSALDLLAEIRKLGLKLELDDFGTGYSSLGYLHRFSFDTLKIDQSFVGRLLGDPETPNIIRAIVSLAASLGMEVVAEGVETEEQRLKLQSLGCELGQGYLFSRPVDALSVETMLASIG